MRPALLTTAFVLLACAPSLAQNAPPAYLDNRSDPASLVKSYYNAVSRREYARAWGYFGDRKPSTDLAAFTKGFADTESVVAVVGDAGVEGAAGSTIYSLPVAITAFQKGGSETVYSGCFVARLANPQIQGEPFMPMTLESATLRVSDKSLEESLPESCGDAPVPAADKLLEQARALFVAGHSAQCSAIRPDGTTEAPETHTISWRYKSSAEGDPDQQARLFRFYCGSGAYNESHIYYLHTEVEGLRELQFATPEMDIRYENDDFDGKVESMSIIGYTATAELVNSFYDEASKTITSAAKWRGIADASSSGVWMFRDGAFTLVKYDVDASYNGEIDPETVLDFHTGP